MKMGIGWNTTINKRYIKYTNTPLKKIEKGNHWWDMKFNSLPCTLLSEIFDILSKLMFALVFFFLMEDCFEHCSIFISLFLLYGFEPFL